MSWYLEIKITEITVTVSWYLEIKKKTEITATMSWYLEIKKMNGYITSILRCIMSIHCGWIHSFFFGIEYHFARELKFSRGLSTLDNFVP